MMICSFPFSDTKLYFALIITFPRPVFKASYIPFLSDTTPPVGKSGPLTISSKSSKVQFGFSILLIVASIISPKLWGGILVAYPADIPFDPFTSKFGNLVGNTVGSFNESS